MKNRIKIVLDADVVIHFIKGGYLSKLHLIFPSYQYVILDIVLKGELSNKDTNLYINNYLRAFPDHIHVINWSPSGEALKEFAQLQKRFGLGETASMVYCKYHHDVIASSNIKDIKHYCEENRITYLTTMDLLWEAYMQKVLSEKECNEFIQAVLDAKSKLPVTRIDLFTPRPIQL